MAFIPSDCYLSGKQAVWAPRVRLTGQATTYGGDCNLHVHAALDAQEPKLAKARQLKQA